MKKIMAIITVCFLLAFPMLVLAEEAPVAVPPEMTAGEIADAEPIIPDVTGLELFTWQSLATIAGSALATVLFVQVFKNPLDKLVKIPTSIMAYVVALAIQVCATAFTVGFSVESVLLAVVNALVVTYAAIGVYEKTFAKAGK